VRAETSAGVTLYKRPQLQNKGRQNMEMAVAKPKDVCMSAEQVGFFT
jgi:hypothetical protein